jgi:hypothetical protein
MWVGCVVYVVQAPKLSVMKLLASVRVLPSGPGYTVSSVS